MQVADTVGRDLRSALCFGENERTLEHGLGMKRQAGSAPIGPYAVDLNRLSDGALKLRGMAADGGVARSPYGGMAVVGFLHHGANKAGELPHLTLQKSFPKIEIAEDPIQRINMSVVGRRREQCICHLGPVVSCCDAKIVLALEVMEEGTLGDTCRGAEIIDCGRCIALGADKGEGSFKQF